MIYGLTQLGVAYRISLVAGVGGLDCAGARRRITRTTCWASVYLDHGAYLPDGFGIFQHGGFGKPHALGIITLVTLGIAALAGRTALFGRLSVYVATVSYRRLFVPLDSGDYETTTRLPLGRRCCRMRTRRN